jgi:hypothetical protein
MLTPLRQRMITAMQMHGYSPRTHLSYLAALRGLAKYTRRSPGSLSRDDLGGYFQCLIAERHLAPATVRLSYNGIRFLYLQVLDWRMLACIPQQRPRPAVSRGPARGFRLLIGRAHGWASAAGAEKLAIGPIRT